MPVDRWSLLALLRFALAAIVAMAHLDDDGPVQRLGRFEAVLGFLVISGYSVTVSFAQRPEGFLRRRAVRVLPVYLASLALMLLVIVFVQHKPWPGAAEIVANGLMLNQLVTTTSILPPAWSLSLECWFYAMLPWLSTLVARRLRQLGWLSFAAFMLYTIGRTLLHWPYHAGVGFGANALLLAFAWIVGSRLARGDADARVALQDLRWMFAGHILLDAVLQFGHRLRHHEAGHFALDDLPGFCLQALTLWVVLRCLALVCAQEDTPRPRSRWMNALGDWSYPLYLVNLPIGVIVAAMGGVPPVAAFGLALAMAILLHHLFERPWRRSTPPPRLETVGQGR